MSHAVKRIVEPLIDPVTLDSAKMQSRIITVLEDELVLTYISSATKWSEIFLDNQLITATYELTMDEFPDDQVFRLPRGPLQSVVSVKYFDTDSVLQTVPSSDYIVDIASLVARVVPVPTKVWPIAENRINAVTVQYISGYGDDVVDVPETIRSAILQLTAHQFEHRESVSELSLNEIPQSVIFLLTPFQVKEFN